MDSKMIIDDFLLKRLFKWVQRDALRKGDKRSGSDTMDKCLWKYSEKAVYFIIGWRYSGGVGVNGKFIRAYRYI